MQKLRYLLSFTLFLCCALVLHAQEGVLEPQKLTGEIIGSDYGYYNGSASTTHNTKENAFDGDATTYFSAYKQSMEYVGLDLGTPHVITRIGIIPRLGLSGAEDMLLGVFEGANQPDFMDAVPLYLISETPTPSTLTFYDINVSRGFRYVRYVGPAKTRCEVADLQFYGYESEGDDSQFYQITTIPTLSIHVKDNKIPTSKGEDFDSWMTLVYEGGTLIQEYPLLTRVRGNFSATHENKPYRIKFDDGKSHRMFQNSPTYESPAKAKKWTLINNYGDKTLIRNNIAYEVSRRVGMPYTPFCRNVDLLLNGEYRGTYQLTDWLGTDPARINITEMAEGNTEGEELTGGYFIEMNGYAKSDPVYFTSNRGYCVTVHSPDDDVIQPEQFEYIHNHFNKMEAAVYSSNYTDPEAGYRPLLDLDTFLKYFLSNEFSTNTDMLWQVFMYKHRGDDRIYTGPVWDNDLALENDGGYYPANEQSDWTYKIRSAWSWSNFVTRVLSDPGAMARLQEIWASLRDREIFTSENIQAYVDSLRVLVAPSARLNHIRWPYLLQKVHCNPTVWGSWDAEVDNVVNYVGGRVAWMDNKLRYNKLDMVNGYYQISTPADLLTFSKFVSNGEVSAKAELKSDLDLTEYSDRYQPIGTLIRTYRGEFKGNNHVIRNLKFNGSRCSGLFGYVGSGAEISGITIDSTCCFSGTTYVGSIIANITSGNVTLECCGNEGKVVGGNHVGGLIGRNFTGTLTLNHCYNTGTVEGDTLVSEFVGFSTGNVLVNHSYNIGAATPNVAGAELVKSNGEVTFTNCYDTQSSRVLSATNEQAKSGELCYVLNHAANSQLWRQNLDNGKVCDTHPVLQTKNGMVYALENSYTNLNPNVEGYRYYMLDISAIQGANTIQFAEFDLLNETLDEYDDVDLYLGTESNIGYEDWPNACDNDVQTKYCSKFNGRAFFMLDAGEEIDIYGYRLYTANDTDEYSDRNPFSWKLYGTNEKTDDPDDTVWELIDERENDYTMSATSYTPYDFLLDRAVQSLKIKPSDCVMAVGDELQLEIEIIPSYMENTELVWSSDNEKVVEVDANGVVTALTEGEAVITVVAPNVGGMSANCNIVVTKETIGYRYYVLELLKISSGSTVQIAEFDFLVNEEACATLSVYNGPDTYFSGESWANLCDNKTTTKYCAPFTSGNSIFFDAGTRIKPEAYRMYTANDTQGSPGRNPVSWKLWGCNEVATKNNRENWILIDSRVDDTTMGATNYTPYDFTIDWRNVVDGIPQYSVSEQPSDYVYDLHGRRVTRSQNGIYIVNKKKVLWQ